MSEPNDPHKRAVDWRNWAGDECCRPASIETPGSIEEISVVLARAAARGHHVRVAGAGYSFSDIAEVTLLCVPVFTLRGIDAPAPLADTLARFEELALGNDHFEFFVFPHSDTALTRTNNHTDESPRPTTPCSARLPGRSLAGGASDGASIQRS